MQRNLIAFLIGATLTALAASCSYHEHHHYPEERETSPKASPVLKQPQAPVQPVEQTVYITRTGEKYHRVGCQYLRKSRIPVKKTQAQSRGYGPCSRCW